ncbi:Laminin Subunit Beta-2 [Manis pentadactyla]|nr:Laminin Subunit Beta-2 [Manis pentadactyla]
MFAKQFKYLTRAYKLTWHDVHVVLQSTLTPEEYDRVTAAAQHCANEAHATNEREPMGREAIPLQEPLWDYNSPEGEACRDHMVHYLLAESILTGEDFIHKIHFTSIGAIADFKIKLLGFPFLSFALDLAVPVMSFPSSSPSQIWKDASCFGSQNYCATSSGEGSRMSFQQKEEPHSVDHPLYLPLEELITEAWKSLSLPLRMGSTANTWQYVWQKGPKT